MEDTDMYILRYPDSSRKICWYQLENLQTKWQCMQPLGPIFVFAYVSIVQAQPQPNSTLTSVWGDHIMG